MLLRFLSVMLSDKNRIHCQKVRKWYEAPIQLTPSGGKTPIAITPTLLAKQGDMAKARVMRIHAAGADAEPSHKDVWQRIARLGNASNLEYDIREVYIGVPAPQKDIISPHLKAGHKPSSEAQPCGMPTGL